MHPVVPPFFLEHYAAGQVDGSFPAVGLFVDISGFSRMTDALMKTGEHGAEVLAGVMRAAFTPLIRSIYEHGGFVASQAGDAFTALFPLNNLQPGGRELAQSCAHALAAAWEIHQQCEHPQHSTPYGTFEIFNKVGLAMGEIAWGIIESADQMRAVLYFQGTAVDGCTNAEHQASAGQVILSGEYLAQVQEWVSVEPVGEHYLVTGVTALPPGVQPAALPAADIQLASRFYPRELFDWPYSGEFRQVVTLFISLPTVQNKAQLNIFMQTVFGLLDQYGGLLAHLDFGDKGTNLLLFWGAPAARENDIQRALDFILSLQTQTEVPINAGITYRMAHTGFIGSEFSEEYTAFGRGVNLAARFMTSTPRGEIWVDEIIAQHAAAQYDLEERGALSFKGFAEPQKVFALSERREVAGPSYSGQIVGRAAELEDLARLVEPVLEGRYAGMLVVWGEPGIGKSRLVHAFTTPPAGNAPQGFQVFLAQTDEILREPFNPFRYWVRNHFGISSQQVEARNKRSFNRKLDEIIALIPDPHLAAELDRTRSFLGALAGLFWPDSLYEQLDAQGRYENTQIALATLLQAESLRQPVIFFLEDAHWLDADSRALLARLGTILTAEEGRAYPIAFLVTSRRDADSRWIEDLPHRSIDLDRLSRSDLKALAGEQLSGPVSESVIDLLESRAEGNPFFAEQILRYLQDSGLLRPSAEGWKIDAASSTLLPANVQAVLVARLDRLAREVKAVVQTAAVLGREFEVRLLAQMLRDQQLTDKVSTAEREAVWFALNEIRYIFRHTLMRDTAYSMQVQSQRQSLHRLALEALETLYAEDRKPHYAELAYHAEQAGSVDTARKYLRLAGDAARDGYQNSQAVLYYTRALDLTPEDDLAARWDLLFARQKIYPLTGEAGLLKQDLAALAGLAEALDSQPRRYEALIGEGFYALNIGDLQPAITLAQQAGAFHRAAGEPGWDARATQILCRALVDMDRYAEAEALYRQTAELGPPDNVEALGFILESLGIANLRQENYEQSLAYFQQAADIFSQNNLVRGTCNSLIDLGSAYSARGDNDQGLRVYEMALALSREIGYRKGEAVARGNLGVTYAFLGRLKEARAEHARAITIHREIQDRSNEGVTLLNLGILLEEMNEYAESQRNLEQALRILREAGSRWFEGYTLSSLGDALVGLGRYEQAAAAYGESLELRQTLSSPVLIIETQAGEARLYMKQGNLAEALSVVEEIIAALGAIGPEVRTRLAGAEQPLRILLTCCQVLTAAGDGRAPGILRYAYDWLQDIAAGLPAEERPAYLENIPWNREICEQVSQA